MLTAPFCSCTTAAIDHVPVTDRLVPVAFQSEPDRFKLRLDPPMSGLDGRVKFNTKDRTAHRRSGVVVDDLRDERVRPITPGEICSCSRTVVPKSEPVT